MNARPKDASKFAVVMSGNDPRILLHILSRADFPKGVEVVTQEHSAVPYLSEIELSPEEDRRRQIAVSQKGLGPVLARLSRKKRQRPGPSPFCETAIWR